MHTQTVSAEVNQGFLLECELGQQHFSVSTLGPLTSRLHKRNNQLNISAISIDLPSFTGSRARVYVRY